MTGTALPVPGPAPPRGLAGMAGIETRRLARSPIFMVGVVLAFGVLALMVASTTTRATPTCCPPRSSRRSSSG